MACPRCGTDCHCASDRSTEARISVLIDPDHYEPSEEMFSATLSSSMTAPVAATPAVAVQTAVAPDPEFYRPPDPEWRDEVTSRLTNYRARRRRSSRSHAQSSMQFDFDARVEAAAALHAEIAALPQLEPEQAKIINFPKAVP